MSEVLLHVYDLKTPGIVELNKLTRDGIGAGGIFHGAIQVYGKEWSFGHNCSGTGVFSAPPRGNSMYNYRETVSLGHTELSREAFTQMLIEVAVDWLGQNYNLLSRNCNNFCDEFCARLGADRPPLWVNRWARIGAAAKDFVLSTMGNLQQANCKVASASKIICRCVVRSVICH